MPAVPVLYVMEFCSSKECDLKHRRDEHENLGPSKRYEGCTEFGKCSKCECKSFHGYVVDSKWLPQLYDPSETEP